MATYFRITTALVLVLGSVTPGYCQDFGDLNRPADVLLGETEASLAKAALVIMLQDYARQQHELHSLRRLSIHGREPEAKEQGETAKRLAEITLSIEKHKIILKETELEIRELCDRLDASWLLPVQTNIDDQQWESLLNKTPQMLVTIRSKSGSVLHPVKLTLTSASDPAIGFAEIRPGMFLANPPVGEYQLAWQLSDKSVVQRRMGFKVEKPACVLYEVTLGSPDIKITTEVKNATLNLPRRATKTGELNKPQDLPNMP